MMKKAFIIMILSAIMINSLTIHVVMASTIDDNATGGGSSSGLTSGSGTLHWSQNMSGYRFTIIDNAGNVVSLGEDDKPGSVDLFFINYKDIDTPYYYNNCKTQPLSAESSGKINNKKLTINDLRKASKISSLPPYPISSDGNGNAKGNGEELKLWLMKSTKWIGTTYQKPTHTSSNTNKTNSTGGSSGKTQRFDVDKANADIISSAKKLKTQLDDNTKISIQVKLATIHTWMDEIALFYTKQYNEKIITKSDYDTVVLGTALDMMSYLQNSNFARELIIPGSYNFNSVNNAIDCNLRRYTSNIDSLGIYDDLKKQWLIDYYVKGEIEHYDKLYIEGNLSEEQHNYLKTYINQAAGRYRKTLKLTSSSIQNNSWVANNKEYIQTYKSENVANITYTYSSPVYLSAPVGKKDTDNAIIKSLSTNSSIQNENTDSGEHGEIIKLLGAVYNGKPLFELSEHYLPEYAYMSTIDIMVEKGYSLLVEPLTYIQPATWNSATKSAGIYFKYYICGTITNYAEALTLLKKHGYWDDLSGGAYSTPTSKLGWSALMVESTWKGDGITVSAPTKQKGTRRPMNELAAASNLDDGVIEGYGMQLYLTNPSGGEFTHEDITPTSNDSGIVLNENEITKVSSLLDSYEGDTSKLKIQSSISEVTDSNHTIYLQDNHGKDKEGNDISCPGHTCVVSMTDNKYNHIYCVSKMLDDNNVILKTKSFTPELLSNSTGVSTVGLSGKNDIMVYPNYVFTLFRSMDVPALASYKSSSEVIKELGELGLKASDGGAEYKSSRLDNGSSKYSFGITLEKDEGSDTTTTYSHSIEAISGNQTHKFGKAKHTVGVTVKTYTGEVNIGNESSDATADEFNIGNYTFINPTRYIINPEDNIVFYPYVSMKYTVDKDTKEAFVLSKNMSVIRNSDFIEVGYCKTNKNSINLLLDSNGWSNHLRSTKFIRENGIKDYHSVLPGGAVYTLQQQENSTTNVGVRTWQTLVPDSQLSHVANGRDYYNSSDAEERRTSLIEQINFNIEKYILTQYVEQGIDLEQKSIINEGTALTAIASGKSQTVFGNQLSKDKKYYLRSDVPASSSDSNAIFTIGDVDTQLVRSVDYTISSDVKGNVYLYRTVNIGIKELIGQIGKAETAGALISQSREIKELDDKTKLVTNYISAIERNHGSDENEDTWYNEAFDGLTVRLSEYIIETALADGAGNGTAVRTSSIDTKLCGFIDSKSDTFNFNTNTADDKVRSSCFAIYPTAAKANVKGFIAECNWGGTEAIPIQLKNIEYLFMSKAFYIPNSSVMDND